MREAVRAAFYGFNVPMEGEVPYFYQDVKGLVSIGVGVLTDPIELALNLPMVKLDGSPASGNDIAAEWSRIKTLPPNDKGQTAAQLGHRYAMPFTRLRLTPEGLRMVLERKMNEMDAYLAKRFAANAETGELGYEDWPCDAQLGVLSLSWACGPAFRFPKCEAALRECDFNTAAIECFMPEEKTISGLRPRNAVNKLLFQNAAIVMAQMDPDVLFWPRDLSTIGIDSQKVDQLEDQPAIVHPAVPLPQPTPSFDDDE